jgi:hypothetical protein
MRLLRLRRLALSFVLLVTVGFGSSASATVCQDDPNAVDFEATVNPETVENFLSALGQLDILPDQINITIPGLCTDHRISIDMALFALITDAAPFMVSPVPGSIVVETDLVGPYAIGIDGDNYMGVNCSSSCQVEIPYIGGIFDGCAIESGIVGPILGLLNVGASWDSVALAQGADTCVTGECKAVHPTTFSDSSLTNYDVDLTGFGACEICINLPDPLPDLGCFDPCDGFDPIIESLTEDAVTDFVSGSFTDSEGEGILIKALTFEIRFDNGCMKIPEVQACQDAMAPAESQEASLVPSSPRSAMIAAFYLAPVALGLFIVRRLERRKSKS